MTEIAQLSNQYAMGKTVYSESMTPWNQLYSSRTAGVSYAALVPTTRPAFCAGYQARYCKPWFASSFYGVSVEGERVVRKSVVFLGYEDAGGQFVPQGTGFVASCNTKGRTFMHIVTAEHVIVHISVELKKDVVIRLNSEAGGTDVMPAPAEDWYYHPDPDCTDVAVLPCDIDRKQVIFAHAPMDDICATKDVIDEYEVTAGDEIFIAGLFTNHFGQDRNIPIIRTGNLAAMPEEPVKTKYKGYIDAYLMESRSIGGLSGSPVFIKRPPLSHRQEQFMLTGGGNAFYLLGMVQGHFDIESDRMDAVSEEDVGSGRINTGIGVVIPVERIIETINQSDLQHQREEIVQNLEKDSAGAVSDVAERQNVNPGEE